MKLKNQIILLVLAVLNLAVCITLIALRIPNQIPAVFNAAEKCVALTSKWVLILGAICPLIFSATAMIVKKHTTLSQSLFLLTIIALYENILFFTYYCLGENLTLGAYIEIPLSLVIFLPVTALTLIFSVKVKNIPYKSFSVFGSKYAKETEFIWTRTHMFAKDVMFSTSFLMLIVTFVFSFFKLYLIELGVFVLLIATCLLLIYFHSKSMYNKYMEMKMRKDALDKKKSEQASSNTEQASQQKPETKAKKSTDKK